MLQPVLPTQLRDGAQLWALALTSETHGWWFEGGLRTRSHFRGEPSPRARVMQLTPLGEHVRRGSWSWYEGLDLMLVEAPSLLPMCLFRLLDSRFGVFFEFSTFRKC